MKSKISVLLLICLAGLFSSVEAAAKRQYIEASELTLVGKLFPDTPVPYHRVDTTVHKGFTDYENLQVRMSSGISVSFRTNTTRITLKAEYGDHRVPRASTKFTACGFDLYANVDGEWVWAGSAAPNPDNMEKAFTLISDMDGNTREYLLYLPNFSEIRSLKIGIDEGAAIEKGPMPFKGRVAMFGSSFTHGSSTTRPGMTWPAQLSRLTGYQFLSLGCGGNSKLQPYFAETLADADVDAFVFDSFSNPKAELIEERLFAFIDIIRAKHPNTPLIFLKTIYRSKRHFNKDTDDVESKKMQMAEEMMRKCVEQYDNVYWIDTTESRSEHLETTVDGTHPSDYGYYLMAESVKRPLLRILKKTVPDVPTTWIATKEGSSFPSKWLFSKQYIPSFEQEWKKDGILRATAGGNGTITALTADGSRLERYDIKDKRPVAGPFKEGDYLLFEFPVKDLQAGSAIGFDAVVTAEKGAPAQWQLEWKDGDVWKQGKKIRIYGPAFGKNHKYSTIYQIFRLSEPIADGSVQVRLRAIGTDVVVNGDDDSTGGLMLITQGYVGAYAQNLGQSVPKDTIKVLCLGNSFTYFSSCPGLLKELAWNEGHYIDIYAAVKGSRMMKHHLDLEMTDELAGYGGYDYVFLNDQSQTPAKVGSDKKNHKELIQDMVGVAAKIRRHSPDCKAVVEWTWAYPAKEFGGFGSLDNFSKYGRKGTVIMTKAVGNAVMSPIEQAFRISREERPDIHIYHTDGHHQSLYGAYLKSCVNYLVLYGEPFGESPADCMLPPEIAKYLRDVAERVVLKKK